MAFFSFSTRDYPEVQRLEAAQDVYAAVANIAVATPRDVVPFVETRVRLLPGITIALTQSSPLLVKRREAQLQDGNDDVALLLNPTGQNSWLTDLAGVGEVECAPGTGCFGFNDRPGDIVFAGTTNWMLNITFSRALMGQMTGDLERSYKSPRLAREGHALLVGSALELLRLSEEDAPLDVLQCSNQLLDLAALAVGAPRDMAVLARQRGLKQARMRALKSDMLVNLHHEKLSLSWMAARHGVSPGYVRAMFEQEGTSFTDYLLELRLQRALHCLRSPVHVARSITEIAYSLGFNNLSWFYRAFKRRFGFPPGEAREA